ncbi:MAG: HlyC/CorC family transporter, partial [Chloroflexi bacterium]|nr:HlyC/CorC family transporter [Chloroflexota bacterium]
LGAALVGWGMAVGAGWGLVALLGALAVAVLALLQTFFRALGRGYPYGVLLLGGPLLAAADGLLTPLLSLVGRLHGLGERWEAGRGPQDVPGPAGAGRRYPALGDEDFAPGPEERRMIRGVLRLEDITARDVMVPRVDILAVEAGTPLPDVAALMGRGGHSRMPVYQETVDHVLGFVHARDLLPALSSPDKVPPLTDILRPAVSIPDSKPLDELLMEFRDRKVSAAIVVDEYGGTEGLITLEDVLEEIVGDIQDEFSREAPRIVRVSPQEAIVDARVTLEEMNELFGSTLEGDGFDTLGGLLVTHLGKVPAPGDTLTVAGLGLRVLAATGRRVLKVRVRRLAAD